MRRTFVLALCASAALALGACGDDDDDAPAGTGGAAMTTETTAAAAEGGALDQAAIDTGVQYTGGKAGRADASLEPVTIGFVVQEGTTPSFPEQTAGAEAAVSFINEHAGGIGGHPVKLDKCILQSEEDGQKCGAQMLDAKVPIVDWGLAVVGNSPYHATVKGAIPTMVAVTSAPADNSSDNTYAMDGGSAAVLYAMSAEAEKQGAKSVAMVSSGNQGGKFSTGQVLTPQLKELGIGIKTVYFNDNATTPDIVAALQAAGASDADVVMLNPSAPAQCISVYDGLKQLGLEKNVITTPICNADTFVDHADPGPEGWSIANFNVNPRIETDPQVRLFRGAMAAYGKEEFTTLGFAPKTFGDLLTIAKFGNEIGADKLTPAAFEEKIKAFRGPMYMIPGELRCGQNLSKDLKSNCGDSGSVAAFRDGKWQDLGAYKNLTAKFGAA